MPSIIHDIRQHIRITTGYISAFGLLLISFLLTMYANKQLIRKGELVEQTNHIITNLGSLLSMVKDAETGYRAFVISKDAQFFSPYVGSRQGADSIIRETLPLLTEKPLQLNLFTSIKENIATKYDQFERQLRSPQSAGVVSSSALADHLTQSSKLMEQIRADVLAMLAVEKKLLAERNNEVRKTSVAVTSIIVASIIIAFFLVVFAFSAHLKENKQRVQAQQDVIAYQDQLNERIQELAHANTKLIQMKGQEKFAAAGRIALIIAHEIRNPLTNINLATEQLNGELGVDENARFLFKIIERNSERINHLVTELLNSTKFSDLVTEKVPLNEMMEEVLLEAREKLSSENITLVRKYGNTDCNVLVDKAKMKVALVNIISNAVEGRQENKNAEFVVETNQNENDTCTITITDKGRGMDEEQVTTLFEPYITHKPNGNGLSLINTQNIILNHKGNIAVKSRKEQGTSFTITLNTKC